MKDVDEYQTRKWLLPEKKQQQTRTYAVHVKQPIGHHKESEGCPREIYSDKPIQTHWSMGDFIWFNFSG